MSNKKNWTRMLVVVLVFGMTMVGLDFPAKVNADDMWANVPNLGLLNGTWKGSFNQSEPMIEMSKRLTQDWIDNMSLAMQDNPVLLNSVQTRKEQLNEAQDELKDIIQTIKGEMTIIINASTNTVSITGTNSNIFSGGNVNALWSAGEKNSEGNADGIKFSSNVADHTITCTFFFLHSFEDKNISFQMNQSGTKVKIISMIIGKTFNPIIGTDFRGIILTKQ